MDEFSDIGQVDGALRDLGELLEHRGEHFELCAIGGAAFLLQEPTRSHATADIDIAAQVAPDGELVAPAPLPPALAQAVLEIGALRQLPRHWINSAVAASFGVRLPEGFIDRAMRRDYGGLVLHVASRIDLFRLKLLAATERRGVHGERHLQDIERATPTAAEIADAAAWVRARLNDPLAFHDRLDALIGRLEQGWS